VREAVDDWKSRLAAEMTGDEDAEDDQGEEDRRS
jgi:hypothetical protein